MYIIVNKATFIVAETIMVIINKKNKKYTEIKIKTSMKIRKY